jgi:hypothetical protein
VHAVFTAQVVVGRGTAHARSVRELRYASDASGTWKWQRLAVVDNSATVEFTYDVATDSLVLVLGNPGGRYRLHVATTPTRSATFGRLLVRYEAPATRAIVPTSVASYGGRITIAARRVNLVSQNPWGSPVLLTGSSAATVGSVTSIPASRSTDSGDSHLGDAGPIVFAASRSRVLVAWTHGGFRTNDQGIWTSWRTYGAGVASTSRPLRRTRSAYDALRGLAIAANGEALIFAVRDPAYA